MIDVDEGQAKAVREQVGTDGSGVSEACDALASAVERLEKQRHVIRETLAPVSVESTERMSDNAEGDPEPPRSRLTAFLLAMGVRVNYEADRLAETINGTDL